LEKELGIKTTMGETLRKEVLLGKYHNNNGVSSHSSKGGGTKNHRQIMKVISWNSIGLRSKEKNEEVGKLIRVEKPLILLLQETKMREKESL